MRITLIAAMSRDRVIGVDNRLPWRLPRDLQRFKQHTLGKPIIMGRKTLVSIGRPLPGRTNIVLSRNRHFGMPGCLVAHDLNAALLLAGPAEEVMIVGGATVYEEALSLAQRIHLTVVDAEKDGDAFFPKFDAGAWREVQSQVFEADAANPHRLHFLTYER